MTYKLDDQIEYLIVASLALLHDSAGFSISIESIFIS